MAAGDNLLEAVTADTVAHETARASKHSLPIGTPCPNCHTALAGPWCYACGQRSEKFNRSIWRLAAEAFEGLTDFDGRLWQTLPRLILRPGQLTRDYLDGHRAGQIPPFRLFLIVLLAVFFAGQLNFQTNNVNFPVKPIDIAKVDQDGGNGLTGALKAMQATPRGRWVANQVLIAAKNPQALLQAMQQWSHEFAVLMLPIAAVMLSVLFLFKRGTYVFDHLIFSMHSLAFQGLLLTGVFLLGTAVTWAAAFLWIAPVHLFFHMRRTYKSHVITTLIRMFALFIGTSIAFGLLMAALVLVGVATVH